MTGFSAGGYVRYTGRMAGCPCRRSEVAVDEANVSYSRQIAMLAERLGDQSAVVFVARNGSETTISWRELDLWALETSVRR